MRRPTQRARPPRPWPAPRPSWLRALSARKGLVAAAAALLALVGAFAVVLPRWVKALGRPVPEATPPVAGAVEGGSGVVERQIRVKLFFQDPGRRGLAVEERPVPFSSDLARQVHLVVAALIAGPRAGLVPTLPPETRVLEVFVSARGVAYVDLSNEVMRAQGGSEAEMITVYSIVNTLTANFPALRRVQILIEDRPVATLAGHVDLTRPLPPDMTLLAGARDVPPPAAGAAR